MARVRCFAVALVVCVTLVPASALGAVRVAPAGVPGGAWRPATYPVAGGPPVLVTTYRPAPVSSGIVAYVAWFDHSRTQLALYPGLSEPPGAVDRGSGSVPHDQRWRLLATFNGGFKAAAGAGGFVVNGRVDTPLRAGLATIVELRDRSVEIVRWAGRIPLRSLVLARQNLLPLVWNGAASPDVTQPWRWGSTLHGAGAVWRTALGITARGDLVYAAAPSQTAASLAAIMVHLGAVRALQLDINPEWPTLIAYRHRGGADPVAIVPNPQQSPYRFLVADNRDFFAVYARPGGTAAVPLH